MLSVGRKGPWEARLKMTQWAAKALGDQWPPNKAVSAGEPCYKNEWV